MLLNHLFIEKPFNFEKRCRTRIIASCLFIVLGAAALLLFLLAGDRMPVLFLEQKHRDFIPGFYVGTGCGLILAGIATIIKNVRYMKNPVLSREREIYETDERNRMLGLRCWAYTGYTMMILLYIGILIGGFISITVLQTLLAVLAFFGVVLLIFRILLQKSM